MIVELKSEFPVTDESCAEATGRTFAEWAEALDAEGFAGKRREAIRWLYDLTGRGADVWWPTTIWVEYERRRGVVNKKDGLAEGYNICVTKSVAASPEAVFAAFTREAELAWLGVAAGTGAVEDGVYADDGGNSGVWLRLRPGKDVRLSWRTAGVGTQTQVDAAFVDSGKGKTGVTLNHARIQTREEADGLRRAWGQAFERLKAQLEH